MDHYGMLRTGLWMKRSHQGLVLWLFLNPQTLSMSVCSISVTDPVRSVNCFYRYFLPRKRQGCKGSRMGIGMMWRVTEELQMRYGRPTDIDYR